MVDLTAITRFKAVCPGVLGMALFAYKVYITIVHSVTARVGVMLPAHQCRINVEGGTEPKWMKTGETI